MLVDLDLNRPAYCVTICLGRLLLVPGLLSRMHLARFGLRDQERGDSDVRLLNDT